MAQGDGPDRPPEPHSSDALGAGLERPISAISCGKCSTSRSGSIPYRNYQAQYELLREPEAAIRRADKVLDTEPDNLVAWWVILRAARDRDPALYREAVAAFKRLSPTPPVP